MSSPELTEDSESLLLGVVNSDGMRAFSPPVFMVNNVVIRRAIGACALLFLTFITSAGCSKKPVSEAAISPPIYVSFDTEGKWLFGPVSRNASISDGRPIVPGTNHTVSVYCSAFDGKNCTLTFIENASDEERKRQLRRESRFVPLGLGYTFKIFESVDVTIRNRM